MFSIVAVAWQWLLQGLTIVRNRAETLPEKEKAFYEGKLHTMRYFFHYELPKIAGLAKRLMETDGLTVSMTDRLFLD